MIRHTLLALLLATPALAQDASPQGQLVEGYLACLLGAGDVPATMQALAAQGWVEGDGEDGLIFMSPGVGDTVFAYMADDGGFCHVESTSIDSATASELLAATLEGAGITGIEYNKSEDGCTELGFGEGATATITSGGNDPQCGSDSNSGVRFVPAALG
ncbi:hypothetical protein [Rhodobacter ferrooxidans]|uniref:Uncharacterized protein n=1 Tax=Rhodobacter ferrooxidans TaxID=371731 RepID=C8S3B7_9RHOB|nr:hypothetical protein [Rhodobacter sp. SW2]EEW24482.1 hypothetical protein Rsw2DRAFT_2545 [Rhodobacter sp. SW2]